ncbi:hypothetical protein K8B33_15930 [Alcanivorax sp. JB21]|uniref:immunity protein Tsi6 family protein n=1 Tax=Alcanivorax limicola TaxID=2874102 RepID=UPI001CBA8322|nr:immunity protein Tsi6 family protein [Alcanivorax limicola]MBZ2190596.1 hypothetical protein [Alcanivorax limicola]
MNQRLIMLDKASKKCDELLVKYPTHEPLKSIKQQLYYLIGLESGRHSDRSRLQDITIGVLTAREIEPIDDEAAEVFYQVAGEVRQM